MFGWDPTICLPWCPVPEFKNLIQNCLNCQPFCNVSSDQSIFVYKFLSLFFFAFLHLLFVNKGCHSSDILTYLLVYFVSVSTSRKHRLSMCRETDKRQASHSTCLTGNVIGMFISVYPRLTNSLIRWAQYDIDQIWQRFYIMHINDIIWQAFHLAVKKFEEKWNRGGQGGREGPLAGSRDSVPVAVRGRRPLRKIGVSGHFKAKYGLFWHGMQVSVSYRLSPHKYTNFPSMCLKLDHWSNNPLAFDREINVLLCKDASTREMAGHLGCHRA